MTTPASFGTRPDCAHTWPAPLGADRHPLASRTTLRVQLQFSQHAWLPNAKYRAVTTPSRNRTHERCVVPCDHHPPYKITLNGYTFIPCWDEQVFYHKNVVNYYQGTGEWPRWTGSERVAIMGHYHNNYLLLKIRYFPRYLYRESRLYRLITQVMQWLLFLALFYPLAYLPLVYSFRHLLVAVPALILGRIFHNRQRFFYRIHPTVRYANLATRCFFHWQADARTILPTPAQPARARKPRSAPEICA